MEENEVRKIIKNNPSCFYWKIKAIDDGFHSYIIKNYTGNSFSEKLYQWLNGEKIRLCDLSGCQNVCSFRNINQGYNQFCSRTCSAEHWSKSSRETRTCLICESEFEARKSEDKKLCSLECRNKWLSKSDVVEERVRKAKQTVKEKHGNPTFRNVKKAKQTKKEKYGDSSFNNIEGMKRTKKERYGDPFYSNIEKTRETTKRKYGNSQISKTDYYKKKYRKTVFKRFYNKLKNSDRLSNKVEPLFSLEDYEGVRYYREYEFRCKSCDTVFSDHMMAGHIPRCPTCFPVREYSSKGEIELYQYIDKITEYNVIKHDTDLLDAKELDIFIPEKNIAFEFNGLYWHSENAGQKNKTYHLNKTRKCEKQGIQLIQIFEDEWIEKRKIIKNRIAYLLGENKNRVYGRNCEIKKITSSERKAFLEKYHLQGDIKNDEVAYGLEFEDHLVALMSFGYSRFEKNAWEIYRFCNSEISVVGGASKLLGRFVRDYDPTKIVSYADRRWSMKGATFYGDLGFQLKSVTDPSYWYMKDYKQREYRFKYKKDRLNKKLEQFDSELTEWENMQLNGYDRIWDCGHLKYVREF